MSANGQTVCVVGLGYIGLPTAVFFASTGLQTVGVDLNEERVSKVQRGIAPFKEPDFEGLLKEVVQSGLLAAQSEMARCDTYIIAVPTPFKQDHLLDRSFIESAAKAIAPLLSGEELIVLESTSPPGTTRWISEVIRKIRPDLFKEDGTTSLLFAHCPERVIPGGIMREMVANDRVIGGTTPAATHRASTLYARFVKGELLETNADTAELSKLAENSFRDVNIAYANELSVICRDLGIDVWELISLANHHPRVNILEPGPGVGGHCIAVDPWFIVESSPKNSNLIRTARRVNDEKPSRVVAEISRMVKSDEDISCVGFLGLTFKANVQDLRESPAVKIVEQFGRMHQEIEIKVCEPNISKMPTKLVGMENVTLTGVEEVFESCSLIVLLVDHDEFRAIDPASLAGKRVIDTRGIWKRGN